MTLDEPTGGPAPRSTADGLPVPDALQGFPVMAPQRLAQVRLAPVVAATTRAVLDMFLGSPSPRRPLVASHDDGALDLLLPEFRADALLAAGVLMETIEGSLGAGDGGTLRLRVPVAAPRPFFLMVEQGTLSIAIPWHSVIRVRLARPESLESLAGREGCGVLARYVSTPHRASERPAVLVGYGLRRALLPADRLVWRMPADPVQVDEPTPQPDLARAVRTSEGEIYWVIDPARLLRGVEPQNLSALLPPPSAEPRLPAPRSRPTPPSDARPARPRLFELKREHVEPLAVPEASSSRAPGAAVAEPNPVEEPAAAPAPEPAPEATPAAPPTPEPAAPPVAIEPTLARLPVAARRVLIAEDSFTGRIFLQRLLETLGCVVESVGTARDLERALAHGSYDALFVDVDLPDAPRAEHLAARPEAAAIRRVALVRDRDDERVAAAAGISHALRKPFEPAELVRVMEAIGLGGAG